MNPSKASKYKYATALLIDDNNLDIHVSKRAISSTNFVNQLRTYSNGKEAFAYLQELAHQADTAPADIPEIILLDLYMPHMNGFEFLEAFATLPPIIQENCKIVVLSTSEKQEDKEIVKKDKNVVRFISKPLQSQHLENL